MRAKLAGIRQRPPSRRFPKGGYEVRFIDPDGSTKRRTFATIADATDFQAKVRTDIARGDYRDDKLARTPFREVVDRWLDAVDVRPTTKAGYRSIVETYIRPRLGGYAVGKITPSVVRSFVKELPNNISETRKRHIFMTLVPIFKLAIDDGMIRTSPTSAASVKPPKRDDREMLAIDEHQTDALANAITPHYRTLIYFAAYSGMRSGELAALTVGDIDFNTRVVRVNKTVVEIAGRRDDPRPPKNGKTRYIKMPTFVIELLKEDPGDRRANKSAFVFTDTQGGPIRMTNFFKRHFRPAVLRALPEDLHRLRFHDLRHSCASILAANGESAKAVSLRLGHSSVAITLDRYTHLWPEAEDGLVDRLDATITAARGSAPAPDADIVELHP
jgi:integrase